MNATAAATRASLAGRVTDYDAIALVLQGGGALGAYQAGVYEALDEVGIRPTRLAGISIGAFNAAIIAGNEPAQRVARLHEFWETICSPGFTEPWFDESTWPSTWRQSLGRLSAWHSVAFGQPNFFRPRLFPPLGIEAPAVPEHASLYDTTPMRHTLERLIDFDRLNDPRCLRLIVSAVNIRTGNFTRFDNRRQRIGIEHIMASGALPPGFPPVEIEGEYYWDGGVVSNTPLNSVLHEYPGCDTLVFQVDLWSARGKLPGDLIEVIERRKEIQYSSRTRSFTEFMRRNQEQRRLLHDLMKLVPKGRRNTAAYRRAQQVESATLTNVIHLIYRDKFGEGHFRDYDFSFASMRRHWQGGLEDMRHTLEHPEWLAPPNAAHPFVTHDVHRIETEQPAARRKRADVKQVQVPKRATRDLDA